MIEKIEKGRPISGPEVRRLIESGYRLLEKAAEEKVK
jgi:hypothetical protein